MDREEFKADFIELIKEVKTPKQKELVEGVLLNHFKSLKVSEYMEMLDELNTAIYITGKE